MKRDYEQAESIPFDWREMLESAVNLGLPKVFNFEWYIDKAEKGEWGGLWW